MLAFLISAYTHTHTQYMCVCLYLHAHTYWIRQLRNRYMRMKTKEEATSDEL